ncbi:unnamed protein product [Vicia faba]|uniref:Uncharacterized protein n=1 Tax=Vicia faba TaxID=3906 RepID=A0AAV1BDI8_VICFA|nr:unnamed protein product [Vicia faba]
MASENENKEITSENDNEENIDREICETRVEGVGEMGDDYGDGEKRMRRPPVCGEGLFDDEAHFTLMVSIDPLCFEEAVKSKNWKLAMDNEIKSIEKNLNGH